MRLKSVMVWTMDSRMSKSMTNMTDNIRVRTQNFLRIVCCSVMNNNKTRRTSNTKYETLELHQTVPAGTLREEVD